jgi:hypothetical protein
MARMHGCMPPTTHHTARFLLAELLLVPDAAMIA